MRVCVVAMGALLSAVMVPAASACPVAACDHVAPLPYGYVPADDRRDLYVANQGPSFDGPDVFTTPLPTWSAGRFAYMRPYPHVQFYTFAQGLHVYRAVRWRRSYASR
jgi:hypothetical protein